MTSYGKLPIIPVETPAQLYLAQVAERVHPSRKFEELANIRELRSVGIEDMPHVWAPPDALPLNKIYAIPVPTAPVTNVQVGAFTTNPDWWAVFKWVSLCTTFPNFPEGTGAMTWRILAAGNPPSDFGNVTVQMGNPNQPVEVGPIIIRPNTRVQVQVDNASINGAGSYVIAILRGWEWPSRRNPR